MTTIPTPKKLTTLIQYRKKTAFISSVPDGHAIDTTSQWDGGSRDYFSALNYLTGEMKSCPTGGFNSRGSYTLCPGEVLLSSGVYSGRAATAHIRFQKSEAIAVCAYFGIDPNLVDETKQFTAAADLIQIPSPPIVTYVDPPSECNIHAFNPSGCRGDGSIVNDFTDANLPPLGWANVCPACASAYGARYGTGIGQRYRKAVDGNFYKVEG